LQIGKSWNILLGRVLYLVVCITSLHLLFLASGVKLLLVVTSLSCEKLFALNRRLKNYSGFTALVCSSCLFPNHRAQTSTIKGMIFWDQRTYFWRVLLSRDTAEHTSVEVYALHTSKAEIFPVVWNHENTNWKGFQEISSTAFCSEKLISGYEY